MKLLDISRPLADGFPAWPGDVAFRREVVVEPVGDLVLRSSSLSLSAHCGTHVDAPLHLQGAGGEARSVAELDLERLVGPARVIDLRGRDLIRAADLSGSSDRGARVLLRTDNSSRPYRMDSFVALDPAAAALLAARGCLLVGIDGPSVDVADSVELPAHRALLTAGVVIIEGLDLARAAAGDYWLTCLPLALHGADGAPARAVLAPAP